MNPRLLLLSFAVTAALVGARALERSGPAALAPSASAQVPPALDDPAVGPDDPPAAEAAAQDEPPEADAAARAPALPTGQPLLDEPPQAEEPPVAEAEVAEEAPAEPVALAQADAEPEPPAVAAPGLPTAVPLGDEEVEVAPPLPPRPDAPLTPAQIRERLQQQEEALAEEQAERERQLADLVGALEQLDENQQVLDERTLALQEEMEATAERGRALEQARVNRIAAYDQALFLLEDVGTFLATGGGTGADARLLQISSQLGSLAANAFETAGEQEATRALEAQAAVDFARAALVRDDLYAARVYLSQAALWVEDALTVAQGTAQPLFRE